MNNPTIETISTRYTCRGYIEKMPAEADVQTIATAAVAAPSAMNRQPWRVAVVKNKGLVEELDANGLAGLVAMYGQATYERIAARGGKLFYNAPAVFFIGVETANKAASMVDVGIVAENIALAATGLGLGSCICGLGACCFYGEKGSGFKKRLFPEGFEFGLCVLVGYAKEAGAPHVPDLSKVSFVE